MEDKSSYPCSTSSSSFLTTRKKERGRNAVDEHVDREVNGWGVVDGAALLAVVVDGDDQASATAPHAHRNRTRIRTWAVAVAVLQSDVSCGPQMPISDGFLWFVSSQQCPWPAGTWMRPAHYTQRLEYTWDRQGRLRDNIFLGRHEKFWAQ